MKIGSSGDGHVGWYCCTHLMCKAPSFLLCCAIEDRVCTSTVPCLLLSCRLRPGNDEAKLKVSWAVHVEGQSHQEISVNRLCGVVSESSTPTRFFEIFHMWRVYCLISNLLIWFYLMVHGAFDLAEWYKYTQYRYITLSKYSSWNTAVGVTPPMWSPCGLSNILIVMTLGILSHQGGVRGLKPVQASCCLQDSLVHSLAFILCVRQGLCSLPPYWSA